MGHSSVDIAQAGPARRSRPLTAPRCQNLISLACFDVKRPSDRDGERASRSAIAEPNNTRLAIKW